MVKFKDIPLKQWIKALLVSIVFVLFILWVGNLWWLLLLPVILDVYLTKFVPWTFWKKTKSKFLYSVMSWVDAIVFARQGIENGVGLIAGVDDQRLGIVGEQVGVGLVQAQGQLLDVHLCLRSMSSTVSRINVTGPSLTDSTFMSAPKRPCWGS